MMQLTKWGGAGLALLYPFVVYFGLAKVDSRILALLLLMLLSCRFFLFKSSTSEITSLAWVPVAAGLVLLMSIITPYDMGLKLYPIAVNAGMLTVFAASLHSGPTIIERIARLQEPELDLRAVNYTRTVTKLWCVFFILNGALSAYTAAFTSLEIWTLYNGLVAYVAMGALVLGEWLTRQWMKSRSNEI